MNVSSSIFAHSRNITGVSVYLDVDGVLNAYMFDKGTLPKGSFGPFRWATIPAEHNGGEEGVRVALSDRLAQAVIETFVQPHVNVFWLTTWQHDAANWLAPTLGLPDWPVLTFDGDVRHTIVPKRERLFQHQMEVGPHPFVWVDDEAHVQYGHLRAQFSDSNLPMPPHHVVPSGWRKGQLNPRAGLRQTHLDGISRFLGDNTSEISGKMLT